MPILILIILLSVGFDVNALINGDSLKGTPDVVRLSLSNEWTCSGVFIDAYTILTAAHCITPGLDGKKIVLLQVISSDNNIVEVKVIKLIPHPLYASQVWPANDVGLIKTSENKKFAKKFNLEVDSVNLIGEAKLFGCGRTDVTKMKYSRTTGENKFLRIGSILFFIGLSKSIDTTPLGLNVTIAPNDSGAPITDKITGKIIAVATTTTAKQSAEYDIAALSTGTSVVTKVNLDFILNNMGQ